MLAIESELVEKYFPAMSSQRREMRKRWNKSQFLPWDDFLSQCAIGEDGLVVFKEIARKASSVDDFMKEARAIQVPGEVSWYFKMVYSNTPFDSIEDVTVNFFNQFNQS